MRAVLKPFRWLYCIYALLLFITGMLLVLPFVVVFSFYGPVRGGNLIYRACLIWDRAWMTLTGMRHVELPGPGPDPEKQYVFVANHISYLDIPVILLVVHRRAFRVLGKAEMRKIPIFGYIYSRAVVMVDRSSPDQRSKSARELIGILHQGISVFIFPEGTFNESDKPLKPFYDGAFRIAIETQTPIKPILFLDTYERMHYSSIFSLNPGRIRTVCLPEVSVEGLTMEDLPVLKERVSRMMEDELVRREASWIRPLNVPQNE
ncbi:MAG: 1-acyl-sn-glycerol-3-phosphate acyltransferase [Chitinophagaceae bacterium]|nr:1-acyl-sn-glycerol-3-phosphate acyltransferase [Chitinophagaceae bacterium]